MILFPFMIVQYDSIETVFLGCFLESDNPLSPSLQKYLEPKKVRNVKKLVYKKITSKKTSPD